MAQKYVDLIIRIVLEIVDWLKNRKNDGRENNESKRNRSKK
jgi:hypothetical protein